MNQNGEEGKNAANGNVLFTSFWPLGVIMIVVSILAMIRYKKTLD